jgi:hypothetical protein
MSDRSLDSLISTELIQLDRNFDDKIDAIKGLLDMIDSNGKVEDRDQALEALKQREEEATTGVGKGIGDRGGADDDGGDRHDGPHDEQPGPEVEPTEAAPLALVDLREAGHGAGLPG